MRLEHITLHGFKSFVEKATVKILPGITGIVGPNGCGKCLPASTLVALADGRVVPIGELVETALARATVVEALDDGLAAFDSSTLVDVLSLNPVTLRLESRPIQAFIKRTSPDFLLRVRTRSGRELVTTHYHPVFSLDAGTLRILTAEDLVPGVRIAIPRVLPVKEAVGQGLAAELLHAFQAEDRVYVPLTLALERSLEVAARRVGGWSALARRCGVPAREWSEVRRGRGVNIAVLGRIARESWAPCVEVEALQSTRRITIRVPQTCDSDLARFLGYLIAEGRVSRAQTVLFTNSDAAITAEYGRLAARLFGVEPRDLRGPRAVLTLISSKPLCLLLDRVFGVKIDGRSADKAVPAAVMTAPDDIIAAFLSSLFEGDAFVHEAKSRAGTAMPYLEYVTASRRLAEDVCTLLLRLGLFPLLRPRAKYASNTRAKRRRLYYSVLVYGVEQMQRLAQRIRFVGAKQQRLDAVAALDVLPNPNRDVVPGVTPLVRDAAYAGGLSVKAWRSISPRLAAYVEQRCEATRDGLREVVGLIEGEGRSPEAARPLLRRLETLAESDVYWDEVASIERTPPPDPWVYDLTVADTHNFVAANVIVHNSNVGEAVRWALGEQSAKSLRGHRMDDLIFHGSASRKPVGLAEVELTFSNDGEISVPFSEIAVTRRLYRTGESEYLLNKAACRLRDILDMFAGTGANPRAYSVMDQDRLNHVLTAKPHERRIFIEEAAGIARYKQQRNETQGKLEATRQNLTRVRDVMEEVRRQLASLERQAKKAQQYKALQAEKRDLALALLAADHATLTNGAATLEGEIGRLRTDADGVRTRLAVLAGREAVQREAIQGSDHRLSDLRQSVQKVQGELERLLERREQMGLQLRETADEASRLTGEIQSTDERIAGLGGERDGARQALGEADALVRERTDAAHTLEARVEAHRAALAGDRDRLEALRLEQMRLAGERTDLMRSAGELRERQSQLGRRAERLAGEVAQADAEAETLAGRRAAVDTAHDRALVELRSLAAERASLERQLREREEELAAAQAALGEVRIALAARQSSLESLRELTRVREGYGAGVRAIFAEGHRETLTGVVGTVADLLDVPRGLEQPIAAVLGERLEWVVVERFKDARAAVAHLDERRAGSATFLPLECLGPASTNGPPGHGDDLTHRLDGVRWVAGEVSAQSANLVDYLLGGVAIVEDLDRAESLWRGNGVVATYVTPAGEVLSPTGRLSGGGERGGQHSLLGRKRELRELDDEVAALQRGLEEAQARVAGLEGEAATLRARLPLVREAIAVNEAARVASEKDLEQWVREQERVLRHRETIGLESRQVAVEAAETEATLDALERRIATAREAEAAHETAMAALRETIETARAREAELGSALTGCRVELASAAERLEALGRELARFDQIEADLTGRLAQARQRQAQNAERGAWLEAERDRTDVAGRDVAVERDRIEEEARVAAARHEDLQAALRQIEGDSRGLESDLRALVGSTHELELRLTEHRVRREELQQEARRSWGVDETALAARHDPARDLDAVRARVGELDEKIESIGAVNLVADEEYRELDERLTFLRTQHDDLVGSVKDLEKALRGMTRTAQERFTQAFHEINAHFSRIFERLFEGGRAELRLVDPEEGADALDTGVELMAQPRGKRLQSVTLLSGGERALTGLALLFAIFYYRPSPFCVLDEVDAPLDDANIHRFLRMLRALTSQTQFIVITHNRKTMEAADILYGVTMEEPGLSKLVSVDLNA